MNKTVEIYFCDLNPTAQKKLLDAEGISSPEEANWDVFPLATLEFETNTEFCHPASNEEWACLLGKFLNLDFHEIEILLEDLNNLRASEWLDAIEESSLPETVIRAFRSDFDLIEEKGD